MESSNELRRQPRFRDTGNLLKDYFCFVVGKLSGCFAGQSSFWVAPVATPSINAMASFRLSETTLLVEIRGGVDGFRITNAAL